MTDDDQWYVLIFEDVSGGQYRRRQLSEVIAAGADRDEARVAALDEARYFEPDHPKIEKGRWVFQTSPDTWVVRMQGAASVSSFEVQVARLVATGDDDESWPDV